MRVEMDGQATSSFSVFHEQARGSGFQQSRHVLEAEDMAPGLLELAREFHIIFQRIFRAGGSRMSPV